MAIKIPSKHIYDISFNPVIDNAIQNVLINYKKTALIDSYNELVSVQRINVENDSIEYGITVTDDLKTNNGRIDVGIDGATIIWEYHGACAFVQYDKYMYINANLIIDKLSPTQNAKITQILLGKDTNNNTNIKCSISGYKKNGTANATWSCNLSASSFSVTKGAISYGAGTNGSKSLITIPLELSETTYVPDYNGEKKITAKVSLASNDNLGTVAVIDHEDYWELPLHIFCGVRTTELSGSVVKTTTKSISMYGSYVEYIPVSLEISIYGNTIKLDLTSASKQLNDKSNIISFEGNELIQDTNTPSLEVKYQGIIDEWKDGKQFATISCPIVDFYDTIGNKVIDINTDDTMLFKIGDIVEPYIFTNKGDRPLSYNKDFTPKQFKVVGTRISTKQGVTQELTLLEV